MTTKRLGQKRPGHGRVVQGGGVELEELDVGNWHTGTQCHGYAVAGGFGRVGGHRVELSCAAGRKHDVAGPHLLATPVGIECDDAHAPVTVDDQVEREPTLENGGGRAPYGVHEGPLDLGAGRSPTRVEDAGRGVPAFSGASQATIGLAIEHGAKRDQLAHASGAFVHQDAHCIDVAKPGPCREGVGLMEVGGVLVTTEHGRHSSLGPSSGGLGEFGLREHADTHAGDIGQPHDSGQPGYSGAEDQDVELRAAPAHRREPPQSPVIRLSSASSCAPTTSTGVFDESTCTIVGTRVSSSASS